MREYVTTYGIILIATIGAGILAYSLLAGNSGSVIVSFASTGPLPPGITDIAISLSDVTLIASDGSTEAAAKASNSFSLKERIASGQAMRMDNRNVTEGAYERMELTIDSIVITEESGAQSEVILPGHMFTMAVPLAVIRGETSSIFIDIPASRLVRQSENGTWISLPTIRVENRHQAVTRISEDQTVTIERGEIDANATFGSTATGEMRLNYSLPKDAVITLDAGTIVVSTPPPVLPEAPAPEVNEVPAEVATSSEPTLD